jgi:hypothetical protein
MRVGCVHFGQAVLVWVSMTFLRSPVLATFDIVLLSLFPADVARMRVRRRESKRQLRL